MKYLALIFFLAIQLTAFGQSTDKITNGEINLIYNHEASGGIMLSTSGLGIFADYAKALDMSSKRLYRFEIVGLNYPKEYKQTNDYVIGPLGYSPKPYVFGKQNALLALHIARGKQILLGDKAEKSGVEVNLVYLYGISIGLVKPYYLDLIYVVDGIRNEIRSEKYDATNQERFMNPQYIFGSSGFSKGLFESKIYPGLHAKAGINFDWANYSDFVKSLEIGITTDLYYKRVPIMVTEQNNALFASLYFSLQFGKKW